MKNIFEHPWWHVRVFFRVVYCAHILNSGKPNGVTWEDMIDRSTFRVGNTVRGTCLNTTFWTNFWLTTGVVIYLKVSMRSPIMISNRIFDLNWQIRMCCEIPLRLCGELVRRENWDVAASKCQRTMADYSLFRSKTIHCSLHENWQFFSNIIKFSTFNLINNCQF